MVDLSTATLPELRAALAGALWRFAEAWGSTEPVRELVERLESTRIADRRVLETCILRMRRATDALRAAWAPASVGHEAEGLVEAAIDLLRMVTAILDSEMLHLSSTAELQRREAAYADVLERAKEAGRHD